MRVEWEWDLGLPDRWLKGKGTSQLPTEADATRSCCLKNSRGLSGRWAIMAAASWGHKERVRAKLGLAEANPCWPHLLSYQLSPLPPILTSSSGSLPLHPAGQPGNETKGTGSWAPPTEALAFLQPVSSTIWQEEPWRWHLSSLRHPVTQLFLSIHKALSLLTSSLDRCLGTQHNSSCSFAKTSNQAPRASRSAPCFVANFS